MSDRVLFRTGIAGALVAAIWAAVAVPALPVLPRPRYTLADLIRQTTERSFLIPTLVLATTTAILMLVAAWEAISLGSPEAPAESHAEATSA